MKTNIKGVGVALITPFNDNGDVDFEALERLLDRVAAGGADYLVVLGTTAETPTLSAAEKEAVTKFIVSKNGGRMPVVIGIGGNRTAGSGRPYPPFRFYRYRCRFYPLHHTTNAFAGGIYQHYKAIAGVSPRPVVMYNIPGRTGVNMTAETTLRLARECKNIIAVKEASGNLSQMAYILRDRPEGFLVISGDDNLTLPLMAMGGDGVISVAVNAYPGKFCRMVHLLQQGDTAAAAGLHLEMMEATDALFAEGNPVGVKAALAYYGLIRNNLRLPLVRSSAVLNERLKELIGRYDLK